MMLRKPFVLSVKALIRNRSGCCLLLKRSMTSKANAGKWDFPGGKVDPGETIDNALLREVFEETGLTITIQHVAGAAESKLVSKNVVYLIMEGRIESGDVHMSSEHDEYIWIDVQELLRMDLAEQFRSFVQIYNQMESLKHKPIQGVNS